MCFCAFPCEVLIELKLVSCIGRLQVTRYKLPIALQYCPIGQNKFYCCGNLPSFATIPAVLVARAAVNPWSKYVLLHFQHRGPVQRERERVNQSFCRVASKTCFSSSTSGQSCLSSEQPTRILGSDPPTTTRVPAGWRPRLRFLHLCLSFCKLWAGFSYDEVMCLVCGKQPTRILGTDPPTTTRVQAGWRPRLLVLHSCATCPCPFVHLWIMGWFFIWCSDVSCLWRATGYLVRARSDFWELGLCSFFISAAKTMYTCVQLELVSLITSCSSATWICETSMFFLVLSGIKHVQCFRCLVSSDCNCFAQGFTAPSS